MRNEDYNYIYLTVLYLASTIAIIRFKKADTGTRIFSCYIIGNTIAESVAFYCAKKYRTNMPVYGVSSLMEFAIISMYFNYTIDVFRKNNLGYYIGVFAILFGIVDLVWIHGFFKMNTYFMMLEGFCTIGMGLYSFLRLFERNERFELKYYHHFWFTTILVFFWSITLTNWSLYNYFLAAKTVDTYGLNVAVIVLNISLYSIMGLIYLFLPNITKLNAR